MDTKEQENTIHRIGKELADKLLGFYGSVEINVQNGRYVNANVRQSMIPESDKQKGK